MKKWIVITTKILENTKQSQLLITIRLGPCVSHKELANNIFFIFNFILIT